MTVHQRFKAGRCKVAKPNSPKHAHPGPKPAPPPGAVIRPSPVPAPARPRPGPYKVRGRGGTRSGPCRSRVPGWDRDPSRPQPPSPGGRPARHVPGKLFCCFGCASARRNYLGRRPVLPPLSSPPFPAAAWEAPLAVFYRLRDGARCKQSFLSCGRGAGGRKVRADKCVRALRQPGANTLSLVCFVMGLGGLCGGPRNLD